MPSEKVESLGVTYDDPHMWIVALIGSADFTLNVDGIERAMKNKAINISIVGLSEEPLSIQRALGYQQVCRGTDEGVFVNIVKKDTC